MRIKTAALFGVLTSLLLVFPVDVGGQDVAPDQPDNPFVEISDTAARIRESASQLDTITAEEKAKIAASLQVIDANKLRYDQASASTKQDVAAATSSEKDSQTAQSQLEELRGSTVAAIENTSSEVLSAEAKTLRERISKTREGLAAVDLRMGSRSSARQSLLTAIDQTNEKLVNRQGELATFPGSDNSLMTAARKLEIFIPLGFIAGFYGMNFHHMPELNWRYGYPSVIALMLSITAGLLLWFRSKGWFGD